MTEATGTTLLSATDIAGAVGVGQSAISNWRNRHADFPEPVVTDDGRELFRLSELNDWLLASGRTPITFTVDEQLWHLMDAWRSRWSTEQTLEAIIAAVVLRSRLARASRGSGKLSDVLQADPSDHGLATLLEAAGLNGQEESFRVLQRVGAQTPNLLSSLDSVELGHTNPEVVIARLIDRWSGGTAQFEEVGTSPSIAQLMAHIAAGRPSAYPRSTRPRLPLVLDPAIGVGTAVSALLSHAPRTSNGRSPFRVSGQDVNGVAVAIARLRLIAEHVRGPDIRLGDSLVDDAFPNRTADLVLADPPMNQKPHAWDERSWAHDPRWRYAPPDPRDATGAWIQHVAQHVAPGGRGIIVVPQAMLFGRARTADLRRALVADNRIAGVVGLPAGVAGNSAVRVCLLVLLGSEDPDATGFVYFIDATDERHLGARMGRHRQLSAEAIDAIAETVCGLDGHEATDDLPVPSVKVPIRDILADPEGSLLPQRWVEAHGPTADAAQVDYDRAAARVGDAANRLRDYGDVPRIRFDALDGPRSLRISDLVKSGAAEVLRPGRLDRSDYVNSGTPVLTQTSLRRDGAPPDFERFVDLNRVSEQVLTQAGDVILATVGERPYAVVDTTGGAVLGPGLEALRLGSSFDPTVVAALLSSSQSRRAVTGSTIPRVRLRDLSIPALPPDTEHTATGALNRLSELEALASEISAAAHEARQVLVESLAAGTDIRIKEEAK
jgi:hypothetical protein